jgi:hypothetical protein
MPKAILEFSLPEEQSEFDSANRGADWKLAMSELDNCLRNCLKFGDGAGGLPVTGIHPDTVQAIRSRLHDILEENGLSLD